MIPGGEELPCLGIQICPGSLTRADGRVPVRDESAPRDGEAGVPFGGLPGGGGLQFGTPLGRLPLGRRDPLVAAAGLLAQQLRPSLGDPLKALGRRGVDLLELSGQ